MLFYYGINDSFLHLEGQCQFNIIDALESLNLVKSRSEAKRILKSKGVKVDDLIFNDNEFSLRKYAKKNSKIKISVGKKKIGIIKVK